MPFKPGKSGNPEGGRLHNQDVRRIKKLTADQLKEVADFLLTTNYKGLEAILDEENEDISLLKLWFARIIEKGIKKGDPFMLNAFLDRVMGKIPDTIEKKYHIVIDHFKSLEALSDEELITQLEQVIQTIKTEKAAILV